MGTGNHSVYATVWLERKLTAGATLNLEQAEIPHYDFDVKQPLPLYLYSKEGMRQG